MSLTTISPALTKPPRTARAHALVGMHAGVWHADELTGGAGRTVTSGHAALDAQLPGGGWPLGALTELLQPTPDTPIWSLLLPAAAARQQASGGAVVLVNPPHEPFAPALAAGGLPAAALLWVRAGTPAGQLWATEQALRCADVVAVLAWLPRARPVELRRLHLAAAQRADSLLFALRPEGAANAASPALLRLRVAVAAGRQDGDAPALHVDILKRRGPPLAAPVPLPAHAEGLRALLAASAQLRRGAVAAGGHVLPFGVPVGDDDQDQGHVLDRLAVAA
ncbi:MAG: translesion DNA synthesis-associated protein ImuA [Pseudomonadota bacterium]|nr:translesion DNA synthesis-associated protein ImuA [Pseudomonadota bacterium]